MRYNHNMNNRNEKNGFNGKKLFEYEIKVSILRFGSGIKSGKTWD